MAAGTYSPPASGSPIIDVDWNIGQTPGGGCNNEFISVQLTVTGVDSSTDTITLGTWTIDQRVPFRDRALATSFTSHLRVPPFDGTTTGRVVLNGARVDTTDSSTPFRHQAEGGAGTNTVDAFVPSNGRGESFWEFDFSDAAHFVPASLRVDRGQAVRVNGRTLVFRVGASGERIRFSYRLASGE